MTDSSGSVIGTGTLSYSKADTLEFVLGSGREDGAERRGHRRCPVPGRCRVNVHRGWPAGWTGPVRRQSGAEPGDDLVHRRADEIGTRADAGFAFLVTPGGPPGN